MNADWTEFSLGPMKLLGYWFGLLALVVVAWLACERYHTHISNPTGRATTYAEYRARLPTPRSVEIVRSGGVQYYAAVGPIKPPLVRASGPPMYVFDDSGRMIDWTIDRNDDPRFQKRWERAEAKDVPVAQLDAALQTHH